MLFTFTLMVNDASSKILSRTQPGFYHTDSTRLRTFSTTLNTSFHAPSQPLLMLILKHCYF